MELMAVDPKLLTPRFWTKSQMSHLLSLLPPATMFLITLISFEQLCDSSAPLRYATYLTYAMLTLLVFTYRKKGTSA